MVFNVFAVHSKCLPTKFGYSFLFKVENVHMTERKLVQDIRAKFAARAKSKAVKTT